MTREFLHVVSWHLFDPDPDHSFLACVCMQRVRLEEEAILRLYALHVATLRGEFNLAAKWVLADLLVKGFLLLMPEQSVLVERVLCGAVLDVIALPEQAYLHTGV